jgi:hypothetical protein
MKKLFVILSIAAGSLLVSCSASVHTKKHGAGVSVGSIEKVQPVENSPRI